MRLGPQDLPTSNLLMVMVLLSHTITSILLSTVHLEIGPSLLSGVIDTALLCALTATLLYATRLQVRLTQTLSALAGTGTLLGLVALPISSWLHAAQAGGSETVTPALILLMLVGWSLAVMGHILRHALSTMLILGLVIASVMYWVTISIMTALFPLGA